MNRSHDRHLNLLSLGLSILCGLMAATSPIAVADQAQFHALLMNEVKIARPRASETDLRGVHFSADPIVDAALAAPTAKDALAIEARSSLTELTRILTPSVSPEILPAARRPLTLVIVPGVFAEFIKTRAFEEVFERPSAAAQAFRERVQAAGASDRVPFVRKYREGASAEEMSEPRALDALLPLGEVYVQGRAVRVILFATEFASLESVGDARARAATFNARLAQYLKLTGDQDLAFVGYSRGTVIGLEMLAQAKAANAPWLHQVKAMISLSGVVWGSALADDTVTNPASPSFRLIADVRATAAALEFTDPNGSLENNTAVGARNTRRWAEFALRAKNLLLEMNKGKKSGLLSLLQVDPRAPVGIFLQMWEELGLKNFVGDYNANIVRFRFFLDELYASILELSSTARTEWWASHDLPKHVRYYAIAAAMANPNANAIEARMYKSRLGYGNGSYDDVSLLQNRLDYERLSHVALNDSQVSVSAAAFLPEAIARLNPRNAGLRTSFLGIAGTHHWGMALREVNHMILGQKNGFPRESMLKALAAQVLIDLER